MVVRAAPKGKRDPYEQVIHRGEKLRAHIAIAEKALGRILPKGAEVHHLDGDGQNNSNENLVICPTRAYHFLLHRRQRALDGCGNANWLRCKYCKTWDDPCNLLVLPQKGNRLDIKHRACKNAYQRKKWHEKHDY